MADRVVRIHSRTARTTEAGTTVAFAVDGLSLPEVRFEVPSGFEGFISDGYDAAVVALLIPAMLAGARIDVEGAIDAELLWSLNEQAGPLLQLTNPTLRQLRVTAARSLNEPAGTAVLTGLSGGVDSMHIAMTHLHNSLASGPLRVSHFVYNDIGRAASRELVTLRQSRSRKLAARLGVPLIEVASNQKEFHSLEFQASHTIHNATVPLLLRAGTRSWLYASGYPLAEVRAAPTHDLASIDPLLLPMLSTSELRLISIGGTMPRVEKTRAIAGWPVAHDFLTVCVRSVPNCGQCDKCLRTLLTLELLGDIGAFAESFDLAAYREARDAFIAKAMASDQFFHREIRDLARERGLQVSRSKRFLAFGRRMLRRSMTRLLEAPWTNRAVRFIRRSTIGERLARAVARRYAHL